MHLISLSSLLFAVSASASAVVPHLFDRDVDPKCNQDNLLRCFINTITPASSFCTSVVGASTVTVSTVTPTVTVTNFATSTTTQQITALSTSDTTTTNLATTTQFFPATTVSTTTLTSYVVVTVTTQSTTTVATRTITPAMKAKRAAITHLPREVDARSVTHLLQARETPAALACLSRNGAASTSYSPSRITSACSCLGIEPTTVSVTATGPASTATTTQTVPATATNVQTVVVTSTITTTATNTVSVTSTTTLASTVTSFTTYSIATSVQVISATATTVAPPPPCATKDLAARPYNGAYKYHQAYAGRGFRETDQNQANSDPTGHPPLRTTYPASSTICQALQNCIDFAITSPNGYFDVALYQLVSDKSYQCVAYFDGSGYTDPKYFTIPDSNVLQAFGYTLQ